ncbi:hypothetical protein [Streptomyces sp. NPDC003015]
MSRSVTEADNAGTSTFTMAAGVLQRQQVCQLPLGGRCVIGVDGAMLDDLTKPAHSPRRNGQLGVAAS